MSTQPSNSPNGSKDAAAKPSTPTGPQPDAKDDLKTRPLAEVEKRLGASAQSYPWCSPLPTT